MQGWRLLNHLEMRNVGRYPYTLVPPVEAKERFLDATRHSSDQFGSQGRRLTVPFEHTIDTIPRLDLKIGEQTFTVGLDPTSSGLAVPAKSCLNCGKTAHPYYDHTTSKEYTSIECDDSTCSHRVCTDFDMHYCAAEVNPRHFTDLQAEGALCSDVISLGATNPLVTQATFARVHNVSDADGFFLGTPGTVDGWFGLHWEPTCLSNCVPSVMEALVTTNEVENAQLGVCMASPNGALDFGGFDAAKHSQELNFVPTFGGPLAFAVGHMAIGGKAPFYKFPMPAQTTLSFDPRIKFSQTVMELMRAELEKLDLPQASVIFSDNGCAKMTEAELAQWPDIELVLAIPSSRSFKFDPDRKCYYPRISSLKKTGEDDPPPILGQPFFETYYVGLDFQDNQIGFAPLTGCSSQMPDVGSPSKSCDKRGLTAGLILLSLVTLCGGVFVGWYFTRRSHRTDGRYTNLIESTYADHMTERAVMEEDPSMPYIAMEGPASTGL